jgi:hypothetical protein
VSAFPTSPQLLAQEPVLRPLLKGPSSTEERSLSDSSPAHHQAIGTGGGFAFDSG